MKNLSDHSLLCLEMLLNVTMLQDDKVRLAIAYYVQRYNSGDQDTLERVSSHFNDHREMAQFLERRADSLLKPFKSKTISKSDSLTF